MCSVQVVMLVWKISPLCHFCTKMEGIFSKGQGSTNIYGLGSIRINTALHSENNVILILYPQLSTDGYRRVNWSWNDMVEGWTFQIVI
jgi:hypothetical protein